MSERSLVEYFAEHENYHCGYCNSPDSNNSHGMWAHILTVQDYQDLIDRGWRRSGKFCYKPTMEQICCPLYTVRCHATNFQLSKSQKKVIKRVNRYLIHGIGANPDKKESCCKEDFEDNNVDCEVDDSSVMAANESEVNESSSMSTVCRAKRKPPKPGTGADPNKPAPRKAKEIRMEKKKQKLNQQQSTSTSESPATPPLANISQQKQSQGKTLEEHLDEPQKAKKVAHKLEIKLVPNHPPTTDFKYSFDDSYTVFRRYQMTIHKEKSSECTKQQFGDFLVNSPLEPRSLGPGLPTGFGSFHQHYILDGKIIAVGVIDILPHCISSVYFYYDPEYSFLSLGTYSALREIAMTRAIHHVYPKIEYYYMGYYVHSCPKMRYKGQYFPSYLLCPETYTWHPIEKCIPKLNQSRYCRFAESTVVDEDGDVNPDGILIFHDREEMSYEIYHALNPEANDQDEVMEYGKFVGKKCAMHMFLFRS